MSEERKFDEAAFDKAVAKPNGWSGVADPVAEIRKMRDGDEAFGKDVLRTALSLVRAHFDGADDVFLEKSRELAARLDKEGRGDLASFVRAQTGDEPSWVPMERKPRAGNAAALRVALESIEDDCRVLDRKDMWEEEGECYYDALRDIREKVSAALAAPPKPPSNTAALREALANVERVAKYCAETPRHTPGYPTDAARADVLYSRIAELGRVARAALAAPARNCDRFSTAEEAYAAWQKHNSLTAICDWLFALAEGKEADHA